MAALRSLPRFRALARVTTLENGFLLRRQRPPPLFLFVITSPIALQQRRFNAFQFGPPLPDQPEESDDKSQSRGGSSSKSGKPEDEESTWRPTLFKMFEAALTTFASVAILGAVGYGYTRYCESTFLYFWKPD